MTGHQRTVRRAILARLKASADVTALVPAGSIHGAGSVTSPAWPFVKFVAPQTLPRTASCLDGAFVTVGVHAFARARVVGGVTVETAEDHASRIGAAIEAALHLWGTTADGARLSVQLVDIGLGVDADDATAMHYRCSARVKVTAAR